MAEEKKWKEVGTNVKYMVEGDEVIIRCKLDESHGLSKSEKTVIIASSGGNKTIEGYKHVRKIGLNLFKYPDAD